MVVPQQHTQASPAWASNKIFWYRRYFCRFVSYLSACIRDIAASSWDAGRNRRIVAAGRDLAAQWDLFRQASAGWLVLDFAILPGWQFQSGRAAGAWVVALPGLPVVAPRPVLASRVLPAAPSRAHLRLVKFVTKSQWCVGNHRTLCEARNAQLPRASRARGRPPPVDLFQLVRVCPEQKSA